MSQPRRRPSFPLRKIVIAVVVLAVLGLGWYFWGKQKSADAEGGYRTEAVQRGDIRVAISATGTLSAISTVTVGSQISGQVTDVRVDFNSPVKKGEVLATIDPSTYQAQLEQGNAQIASARASLAQAQASLNNAQLDYRRKADLGKQKLVAQGDVDQARAAFEQARAQVNSAQAQIHQQTAALKNTQVNIGRSVIRSPVDGVVLTRKIEPGQTVAASLQAPELFTIAEDLAKMKIELAVDESDIGQVKVGQAVNFTADAFPDRQFKGVVDQVRLSATTTSNVVTYPVVVTVDNSDGTLLPGLTVNAEIEVSKRAGVLKVANAALRYKPAEAAASSQQAPQGMRAGGGSMAEDLQRSAQALNLNDAQQAALQQALDDMRQRQAAREASAQNGQQGGNRLFGGGQGGQRMVIMGGGGNSSMQAQIRQRMRERMQQQFAAFRATLDQTQAAQWDAAVDGLLNAKRAPVYKLVDGKPEMAMVRIGASDGTSTEISGNVKEGDVLVAGERAAASESK